MKVFKFFRYVILGILIMLIFQFVLVLIMRMVTIYTGLKEDLHL